MVSWVSECDAYDAGQDDGGLVIHYTIDCPTYLEPGTFTIVLAEGDYSFDPATGVLTLFEVTVADCYGSTSDLGPIELGREDFGVNDSYVNSDAIGDMGALVDFFPMVEGDGTYDIFALGFVSGDMVMDAREWHVYGSAGDGRIVSYEPKIGSLDGGLRPGEQLRVIPRPPNKPVPLTVVVLTEAVEGKLWEEERDLAYRHYELKDHLGNVRAVVSEFKNYE